MLSVPFKIESVVGTYSVPVASNPFVKCSNTQYDVRSRYWIGINGFDMLTSSVTR